MTLRTPVALTIAGSDSGGGAGIQADLRTFAAMGVFGTSAVTCLTAQNPAGVKGVAPTNPEFVASQIEAVLDGFRVRAIKTGMLFSRAILDQVTNTLERAGAGNRQPARVDNQQAGAIGLVVDPVMVATSGDRLVEDDAVAGYLDRLIPLATVVTPNLDELEVLTGRVCKTREQAGDAGRALFERTGAPILVKGGHLDGPAEDVLVDQEGAHRFEGARVAGVHTHGSGCTYAAAIAAGLAHGHPLRQAVMEAKRFLASAFSNPAILSEGLALCAGLASTEPGPTKRKRPSREAVRS